MARPMVLLAVVAVIGTGSGCTPGGSAAAGAAPAEPAGPTGPTGPTAGAPVTPPGPPLLAPVAVVQLGGAGDEWARGISAAPDGSVVIGTAMGPAQPPPQRDDDPTTPTFDVDPVYDTLRFTKLDAALRPIWSRDVPTGGARAYARARASPMGSTLVVLSYSASPVDLGGGPLERGVAELGPAGELLRQWVGPANDAAADGDGNVLLGWGVAPFSPWVPGSASVTLVGPDGGERWSRRGPATASATSVAASPDGSWVVEWVGPGYDCAAEIEKLTPDGDSLWTVPVSRCGSLRVDADGAVVLGFTFIGTLAVGDRVVLQDGPGVIGAVGIIDADGHPLAAWKRPGNGPVAAGAPDGALAFLEQAGASEYGGTSRFAGHCETRLVVRARDGTVLSDRTVADCTSTGGAWWEHAAVSPDGAITVLGDATASLALGSEAFVPSARDVFVVRVAP